MNVLRTAYYTIIKSFRDTKTLKIQMLLPIILILILGTALNSFFTPTNFEKFSVYYLNEDEGTLSKKFDEFLNNEEIKSLIEIKDIKSYEKGKKDVENGDIAAFIHIPEDFSSNIQSGEKGCIEVLTCEYYLEGESVVKNIVDGFINGANAYDAVYKTGGKINNYKDYENIDNEGISYKGKIPRAIDYYSVTMLVMIMMYGMYYGMYSLVEDKYTNTYTRIKSAPIHGYEINIGKTIGNVLTLFLQEILLMIFTKYVYNSNWSGNLLITILILFIFSVFAISLGMLIYEVFRDYNKASNFVDLIVPFFTFISGGYVKVDILGPFVEKISKFSPNYLAQNALFTNIYGGKASDIYFAIAGLTIMSIVFYAVTSVLGRRSYNWVFL